MRITVSVTVDLPESGGIDEAEELVLEAGRRAMRAALAEACREAGRASACCPRCGSREARTEGTDRRVALASFGRVVLPLRRLRCGGCGYRHRPADGFLAGLAGANVTGKLREACALAGASWPYQTAARVLGELCGARVSKETLRRVTAGAGSAEAEHQAREAGLAHAPTRASVRAKRAQPARRTPELLLVGLDGGWVPSRDTPGGMEGKVGVVATEVEPVGLLGRKRLTRRRLVATFGSSRRLGVLACAACTELGGHEARRRAVLGDGAGWIKTEAEQHFGSAVRVLDWPHVWRAIARAVRAARPGKERRGERGELYASLRARLWRGRVDEAISVLAGLRGADEVAAIEDAIGYLDGQRGWIGDYEAWKEQGYPVGSGMVERQVELVINRRLKKRGMRWLRANADAVTALRVAHLNRDWDDQIEDRAA